MKVLGIETSCDETGVAVYDTDSGLLGQALHSQVALHADYGGVVPELASRDHIQKLMPLVDEVMGQTCLSLSDLDGIAFTRGPGLMGALLVGSAFGRSLAYSLGIPAIGVHHMEGHLLAPMLAEEAPDLPFVALLVSGGHTQLMGVEQIGDYRLLGQSVDDAVGEAFDKTANMLELGYPGGPAVARAAELVEPGRFTFPRPMTDRPGLDFSFSGLKTCAINTYIEHKAEANIAGHIASAFQIAAIETLVIKCRRALEHTGYDRLVVAGGVGANRYLRERLQQESQKLFVKVFFPPAEYCTDNGAMIALAGALRLKAGQTDDMDFAGRARWPMSELSAV